MTSSLLDQTLESALKYHQDGAFQQAHELYGQVLAADPLRADAWHLRGLIKVRQGKRAHGEAEIRHAIALQPDATEFQANLAAILVNHQEAEEAEQLCRSILKHNPDHFAALTHLGTALRQQRRRNDAVRIFRRALAVKRDCTSLCNLAAVLTDLGRTQEARLLLESAVQMNGNLVEPRLNLAAILRENGESSAALEYLTSAEKIAPDSCPIHVNRGNLLLDLGRAIDAVRSFQKAIEINPEHAPAVAGLGRALQHLAAWNEAIEAHRLAVALEPNNPAYASGHLYAITLCPNFSIDEVVQRHVEWGRRIEAATPVREHNYPDDAPRRLRIGYMSPDFRNHATMKFLYPVLEAHDRDAFQIHLFSETGSEDEGTDAIRRLADHWYWTRPLSDEQLADQIQRAQIDILIDLAGHTAENRLAAFARKPAPVQVSFLGYPTTTGLSRIDYYLTDAVREPNDPARFFAETPILLPNGSCCFAPGDAPAVSESPCQKNGYVTLGSTHRLEKISSYVLGIWAEVMSTIPTSRLLIFRDVLRHETLRQETAARLHQAGIDLTRIDFGWTVPRPHLAVYEQIDILLDVFPWGSGTTAYDAMWMGVPIPTIAGDRGGCRSTASLLHFTGFPELIADSAGAYVEIVRSLAAEPTALAELRARIRPAVEKTNGNGPRFTRDLEQAFRDMWDQYLAQTRERPQLISSPGSRGD